MGISQVPHLSNLTHYNSHYNKHTARQQPTSNLQPPTAIMETTKNVASAASEKLQEGGQHIASAFKCEEDANVSKQKAAEHHGRAEANWEQAKDNVKQGVQQGKEETSQAMGKLDEKVKIKAQQTTKDA